MSRRAVPNSTHWGAFTAALDGDGFRVQPHPLDPAPSPLLGNLVDGIRHRARVARPAIRRGWLERGPGPDPARGRDEFVEVDWDTAERLLADELRRVRAEHGNEAIYGGSYGWASAGRFHHAQSQLHRFLGCFGGYVRSVNTYSHGASVVVLPHIVGPAALWDVIGGGTSWSVIAEHTELLVAFGGLRTTNTWVAPGGHSRHANRGQLADAVRRGMRLVNVSPLRDDVPEQLGADWCPVVPGADVAAMLALSRVLITEGLADLEFLRHYTVGAERFLGYLAGEPDGVPKEPEWAEPLCGIPAERLRALARDMAAHRTLVHVSWSLQRTEYGEQPVWAGIALAALLGQIGLPGGGFGHGYGSMADVGSTGGPYSLPALARPRNRVTEFIPVAKVADMLLHPGEEFDYNGQRLRYPHARLVYWIGGNPFHHHQDLSRLRRAFARPDTVVVHEPYWTATARHADIVLPATTTLERDDLGAGRGDRDLLAMQQVAPPYGRSRNDYDIFAGLAARLGIAEEFTEGRDSAGWVRHLYTVWRERMDSCGYRVPEFDEFWAAGSFALPDTDPRRVLFEQFRADPEAHPLSTPSGRIELYSETVAGFGYDDCPGYPCWLPPREPADSGQLHLIANQPVGRLHSQLDMGAVSQRFKVAGREALRLHPQDAAERGIQDGQVVRVHNARGSCLAGVVVSDALMPGVAQLSTGAWFAPSDAGSDPVTCVHGNPNVLTTDRGTSRLAQGCTGQHAVVQVEPAATPVPEARPFEPPTSLHMAGSSAAKTSDPA